MIRPIWLRAGMCKLACISWERIYDAFAGTPSLETFKKNQREAALWKDHKENDKLPTLIRERETHTAKYSKLWTFASTTRIGWHGFQVTSRFETLIRLASFPNVPLEVPWPKKSDQTFQCLLAIVIADSFDTPAVFVVAHLVNFPFQLKRSLHDWLKGAQLSQLFTLCKSVHPQSIVPIQMQRFVQAWGLW